MLERCRASRLDRIVTAIEAGSLGSSPGDLVLYLIFELADGDGRQLLASAKKSISLGTYGFFIRSQESDKARALAVKLSRGVTDVDLRMLIARLR